MRVPGHVESLDSTTSFFLFVFTVLVHVATMFALDGISILFREYISSTGGAVNNPVHTVSNIDTQPTLLHASYRPIRDLHDTLDVTVFM